MVVLKVHEGKQQPELPLEVSLNGVIQFIATLAQFAFAYPLVQALSQLKWLWFIPSDPRPLTNFEAYDDACRGGWGSVRLLFRLRGSGFSSRLLTQLAALVMASTVLTGPLTQQAMAFQPVLQPVPGQSSGGSHANRVTSFATRSNGAYARRMFRV